MTPERWKKLEELFQAASELPALERDLYLEKNCGGDLALIEEVNRLLSSAEQSNEFIERSVWTDNRFIDTEVKRDISDSLGDEESDEREIGYIGKKIGPFRLAKEIGRGGMGAVYLAERDDGEFSQRVAVKLIKRGMDSDFIIRRFRHERQILASFEHPYIARLLDGGTTPEGTPYFAMEFIEGETLYDYCDSRGMKIHDRLELFLKICSAIQYAHDRHIVHRDVKPGNILIDQGGNPKLLDFGIAKILDPDLIHESVNPTASMLRMMTPDYASPEQIRGDEVTHLSDIYGMGVLLYELLTGHRPYRLERRALHEVSKMIVEEMPMPPSASLEDETTLLRQYGKGTGSFLDSRSIDLDQLRALLKGSLDNIVMKAMAKIPEDRYLTVSELSDDIRRYLDGAEVSATGFETVSATDPRGVAVAASRQTVAVLPFRFINLAPGGSSEEAFLGPGLTDALITRLSKVRTLTVRPTSSVQRLGASVADPIAAGRELRVDLIIDGSVKKAADRLRVSIQLLSVKDNVTVWATSIDETIADVLTLEDTLANRVIEALMPELAGGERDDFAKRGTLVPKAFEHYLRGRFHFNKQTEEGLAAAFVEFHSAIAADPNYALAYAGIADYYNWLGMIGVLPPSECFLPAIEAATKALEIDENLSEAHASLGFSVHAGDLDWARAEHHLQRALELNPTNAQACVRYSLVLFTQGRFEEGLLSARLGAELDHLTPFNHHIIAWGLYFARRFDQAAERYRRLISDFPDYGLGYYGLSKIHRITGDTKAAIRENERANALLNQSIFSQLSEAECVAAEGRVDEALQKIEKLSSLSEIRYVSPYQMALTYAFLVRAERKRDKGNEDQRVEEFTDKAFELLRQSLDTKEFWINWLAVEPAFDPIRNDPRFEELIDKTGYRQFLGPESEGTRTPTANLASKEHVGDDTTLILTQDTGKVLTGPTKPSGSLLGWGRSYAAIAAVLLIGAILVWAFWTTRLGPGGAQDSRQAFVSPRIVVLPFTSQSAEEGSLGLGFSDALTTKLGYIKGLEMVSANTGRIVAGREVRDIYNSYNVQFVIRGSLERKGGVAAVTAELVNAASGGTVWKEVFEGGDRDLFELQTRLAEKVWTSLGIEPLPLERQQVEKSYTSNPRAYELYLLGRYHLTRRSPSDLRLAISTFGESLAQDGEFAPAFVGIADAYALLKLYDTDAPADAYAIAEDYVKKALAMDDGLAEAHAAFAYISFYAKRDPAVAELGFRRAIQLNPSLAQAHHWFALFLSAVGKQTEALQEIESARRLDPSSASVLSASGMVKFYGGDLDGAIADCDAAVGIFPNFVPALKVKRWTLAAMGETEKAGEVFDLEIKAFNGDPGHPSWQIIAAQSGRLGTSQADAIKMLDKAVADPEIRDNPYAYAFETALAYLSLGETEKAFSHLFRAEAASSHGFNFLNVDPRLAHIRTDPRFSLLSEKLGTKSPD